VAFVVAEKFSEIYIYIRATSMPIMLYTSVSPSFRLLCIHVRTIPLHILHLVLMTEASTLAGSRVFFVTVRPGTAYRHLFEEKKKIVCNVYFERISYLRTGTFFEVG